MHRSPSASPVTSEDLPINRTSIHTLRIRNMLLLFISSSSLLYLNPMDSPSQARTPNSISVRFGRSIHQRLRDNQLEIDTVITSTKHSDPISIRSRAFRSIQSFNRYHSHSQFSVHDTHRNRHYTPSPYPPPMSSTHHNLYITTRRNTHLAQRNPRTSHNSCSQYITNATPYSHSQ